MQSAIGRAPGARPCGSPGAVRHLHKMCHENGLKRLCSKRQQLSIRKHLRPARRSRPGARAEEVKAHQRALARAGVVHHRQRVILAQAQPAGLQLQRFHGRGEVDVRVGHLRQLGQVAADERAAGVELLRLRDRIEDAEPGLRVAAGGGGPLPAAVVGGQVVVVQVLGEVALAPAPVDAQVLGQKAGHHHAQAVVHVAGLPQLAHGRVHQRVAGARLAPGLPELGRIVPLHAVIRGPERLRDDVRVVPQDHEVEVAPRQFGQPCLRARAALGGLPGRQVRQLADGHGAEAQVHRQVGHPLAPRIVARRVVRGHARHEVPQQPLGALYAGGQGQRPGVGQRKAQAGQRWQRLARRRRGQVPGVALHRIRRALEGVEPVQPGALVGREHAVGLALAGQHLVAFEQHLVLVVAEGDALGAQGLGHVPVAGDGLGLVVAVGQHLAHAQAARELHDAFARRAMAHDQPAAGRAAARGELAQALVQRLRAGMDERHAPVAAAGQRIQDAGVEDEGAVHPLVAAQRVVQGGVVVAAQVAPHPHQGAGGHRGAQACITTGPPLSSARW